MSTRTFGSISTPSRFNWGTNDDDIIYGDWNYGGRGNDTFHIYGHYTNGTSYGGDGNDTFNDHNNHSTYLYGGDGDDKYYVDFFEYGWNAISSLDNADHTESYITDTSGTDTLYLSVASSDANLSYDIIGNTELWVVYTHPVSGTTNRIAILDPFTENFAIDTIQFSDTAWSLSNLPFAQSSTTLAADLTGGAGDDLLLGDNNSNILDATSGDDSTSDGVDILYGYGGNDVLQVSDGWNRMYGGTGDDDYYVLAGTGGLYTPYRSQTYVGDAQGGNDSFHFVIDSTDPFLTMSLYEGALRLNYYVDPLSPYFADVFIEDQYANKNSNGSFAIKIENFVFNDTTIAAEDMPIVKTLTTLDTSYNTWTNSAQQVILGHSNGDDISVGYGQFIIYGQEGNDYIHVPTLYEASVDKLIIFGGAGADSIVTTGGNDYIEGNDGDDEIDTRGGDDVVYGGAGNDLIVSGIGNDTLYGESGNDELRGGKGSDTLFGGDGNDTLYANTIDLSDAESLSTWNPYEAGEGLHGIFGTLTGILDILNGGAGNDTMYGSYAGNVEFNGGAGNDIYNLRPMNSGAPYLRGNRSIIQEEYDVSATNVDKISGDFSYPLWPSASTIYTRSGNDLIITYIPYSGSTDSENAITVIANQFVRGYHIESIEYPADPVTYPTLYLVEDKTSGNDVVSGGTNAIGMTDNIIRGLGGNDTIKGRAGDDILYGNDGNDTIHGDDGNNSATAGNDQLDGGAGADSLYGEKGNDQLWGGTGNDILSGGDGDDIIYGEDDDDTVEGGIGNDIMSGESGTDLLIYANAASGITINLSLTSAQNTGGAGTDTISGFENLNGSSYADNLYGNSGNNVINGGSGNDIIYADLGNDTLFGGLGSNTVNFSLTAAIVFDLSITTSQNTVGAGTDTISGFDNIVGSAYADVLTGNSSNNNINGGNGDDIIEGGAGNDVLVGGIGNDTISYANAASAITLNMGSTSSQNTVGAGTDTVSGFEYIKGSAYNDTLTGNTSNNIIEGGAGNDTLNGGSGTDTASYESAGSAVAVSLSVTTAQNTGGAGTDTLTSFESLTGSAFGDTLTGSSIANIISGGAGNDHINGGAGADTLYGDNGADIFTFDTAGLGTPDTLSDFSIADGDAIDISALLVGYDPLTSAITDFITLSVSGGNTSVSIDCDGTAGAYSTQNIASIVGVTGLDVGDMLTNGNLIA